jgi:hypothetical protein
MEPKPISTISPITSQLKDMVINSQLPCTRCGYDLKSLFADGNCPECGEPIRLTIIDSVDPAARRLPPISNPVATGNALVGVSVFLFFSIIFAVTVLVSNASDSLPIPKFFRTVDGPVWICISSAMSFLAFACLFPIIRICRSGINHGCRLGVALTGFGLLSFAILMAASRWILLGGQDHGGVITLLFDTILPVISLGVAFSGLRRLVPRLGQRSREFRLAQGSRQRMNDLLAALGFVVIGRVGISISPDGSSIATFSMIIMVLSTTLILVGLLYLIRNTMWIRSALCTPPPSLQQLLKTKEN